MILASNFFIPTQPISPGEMCMLPCKRFGRNFFFQITYIERYTFIHSEVSIEKPNFLTKFNKREFFVAKRQQKFQTFLKLSGDLLSKCIIFQIES